MGACVASHQRVQGMLHRREVIGREAGRRHAAQRIAIDRGIVGRDEARLARHRYRYRPAFVHQALEPWTGRALGSLAELRRRLVAEPSQQVVELVGVARLPADRELLELRLELLEHLRLDQLAQLGLTEQLLQQIADPG